MVMEKAVPVEKRGEMKMEIISDMTAEQETLLERLKMFLMMADGNVFTVAAPMLASLVDVDLQTAEAVADKLRGLNITVAVEADGEQKQVSILDDVAICSDSDEVRITLNPLFVQDVKTQAFS